MADNTAQPIITSTSKKLTIGWLDISKAFIVAAIGGALTVLENALTTSPVVISWKAVGIAALTAGIAYLTKNFFTPSTTVISNPPAPGTSVVVKIPPPGTATIAGPVVK